MGILLISKTGLTKPDLDSYTKPSLLSKLLIFFSGGANLSNALAIRSKNCFEFSSIIFATT